MTAVIRVELAKLLALWRVRLAVLLVVVAPWPVAVALQLQSGLPTDALYGRWVQDIGLAFPLVLLASAGVWVVPFLGSAVAGECWAGEHAHGTFPTLLTRSRSASQLLAGKAVVAAAVTLVLLALLATSALAAGVALVGTQDLVGLTGQPVPFGRGVGLVALAWASTLPTALAVAGVALALSVVTRSVLVAVVGPPLVVAVLSLVAMLAPLGGVRPLLLAPGLTAWHGLLLEDVDASGVLAGSGVAAVVGALAVLVAAVVVDRREGAAL